MRWEDERYVRLYTRDTATWKLLPWQSKALLPLILRKLDRAGMADIGEDDWGVALAALLDVPVDFIDAGMPELLRRGIFTMRDGTIAMPKYVPAQEARQSAAQRKREQRFRENLRVESHEVTTGHTKSQPVTPSLAEPSLAYIEKAPSEPAPEPKKPKRATQCPDGGVDAVSVSAWLVKWNIPESDGEVPRFLDYHRAKGTASKDWAASWRTWMSNAERFGRRASLPLLPKQPLPPSGIPAGTLIPGSPRPRDA